MSACRKVVLWRAHAGPSTRPLLLPAERRAADAGDGYMAAGCVVLTARKAKQGRSSLAQFGLREITPWSRKTAVRNYLTLGSLLIARNEI